MKAPLVEIRKIDLLHIYGASIAALTFLAHQKGYELVAGNSAGNNIFLVKKEFLNGLKPITVEEAYATPTFARKS